VQDICHRLQPDLIEVAPLRFVACHFVQPQQAQPAGSTGGTEATEPTQQGVNA
jgi:oligopeptide transport system ATP-binding protein